jgi:hypothetical protein
MKKNNRGEATDEIIGVAFKHSLLAILSVAVLIAMAVVIYRALQVKETFVEAPSVSPALVDNEVQAPAVRFVDITEDAGVDFVHTNGAAGDKLLPETMGSGAAFFDYDNDGDQDLLLINSDGWPERAEAGAQRPTMKLYANDGKGNFSDVTDKAGLGVPLYGMGVAVGDYDNDDDADVFVTAFGSNRLFRNDGESFRDATAEAGVSGGADTWSTGASFVDVDNDGDLDLFVTNYVQWSKEIDLNVNFQIVGIGRAYGPPSAYKGTHNYLYRNDSNGHFVDVSAASGIHVDNPATGEPMGKALAVAPVDIDGDGWLDLMVANDTVQNFLFHNQGHGIFEERGSLLGVAFDRDGKATGAMGVDVAHFRNDAELGFAVGNFANEMTSLYVTRDAVPPLTDEAIVEGVGPSSRLALTFGLFFFDYDLDGRLDILQANGHLETDINEVQSSQHYRQAAQLYWNCGDACRSSFLLQPGTVNGDLATPLVGRGATYADIDGDGDLDVVITQNGGPPLLLRNDLAPGNHWIRLKLVGNAVNRDAIGAWVEVRTGDTVQRRQVMPSRSYLSQVESVLTFGLGDATRVDSVAILWPDGSRQSLDTVAIDSQIEVVQQR